MMKSLRKYFVLILLLGCLGYMMVEKTIDNYRLKKYGLLSKGVVLHKKTIGGKGTINIEYSFKTQEGERFKGETNNENYNIGDSILVLYLNSNPDINASKSFIDNY